MARLPGLCGALRAAGAPEVARLLLAGAWGWIRDQLRFWTTTARAGMREPQLERLGAIIARPLRDEDDWSIGWTGCGCDLCGTLGTFLGSRSRRIFEWPLATDGRRHVHTRIDSAGLPVRHQTRRQGRPYTLVLTKTEELFTREKDARHKAMTDLAWLTSAWSDGSPGTSLPSTWRHDGVCAPLEATAVR